MVQDAVGLVSEESCSLDVSVSWALFPPCSDEAKDVRELYTVQQRVVSMLK